MRILVITIAIAIAPCPARADREEAAAQLHLDRGREAFQAKDFPRARSEFRAASELAPDRPNPYRWLALTDVQLGDCAAALGNIAQFVERVRADDPRLPELTRWAELCKRTGVLRVDATPPATLSIDGAVVGGTPFRSLSMRAGQHTLIAERAGFRTATRSITLDPGGELDVRFALDPARPPITRRWWFWTAVGAAALATGAIVFAATRDDPATLLPPINCDLGGCRP